MDALLSLPALHFNFEKAVTWYQTLESVISIMFMVLKSD